LHNPNFSGKNLDIFQNLIPKTAILKSGCFLFYDFRFPKTGAQMTGK